MSPDEFKARLERVIAHDLGAPGTIKSLAMLTGGAAKRTYAVDVVIGERVSRLIVQLSSKPAELVARLTPRLDADEDARLMQAAVASGVLAPTVRTILTEDAGLGPGFITDFITGEALGRRIVHGESFASARKRLVGQCAQNLAAIHRIPANDHPYLMSFPASTQIDAFAQEVAHYGVRRPELAYGFAWAREHLPKQANMTLVHGDFRMGNLLVDADGLRCVLDWEAAHLGDPMQDLGWFCLRTWRFGGKKPVAGIGEREDLFAAYEAAGGARVDREAVRFWEAWGNIKWAVIAMRKGVRFRDGGKPQLEDCAIGRRMEEPLWDFFQLIRQGAQ